MKYLSFLSIVLILFSCNNDRQVASKNYEKEISATWNAFIEQWENENTEGIVDFYEEDGINIPPRSRICNGRADIASFYNVLFENNLSSRYQNEIISLNAADSIAIEHGNFTVNWIRNDSTPFLYKARSVTHWKLQKDGTWKIKLFLFNQPPNK